MKLTDCYLEEDLFPKIFADYEERPYGVLFYSTNNKDSYDSNHAVIYKDKVIGLLYGHISERACRVDYLLVSKMHRRMGAGRALFYEYVEWCKQNDIKNIYIWPDGETPKKIYEEGGYKIVEVRKAGRAVFEG